VAKVGTSNPNRTVSLEGCSAKVENNNNNNNNNNEILKLSEHNNINCEAIQAKIWGCGFWSDVYRVQHGCSV
jgi:hypothetical protein